MYKTIGTSQIGEVIVDVMSRKAAHTRSLRMYRGHATTQSSTPAGYLNLLIESLRPLGACLGLDGVARFTEGDRRRACVFTGSAYNDWKRVTDWDTSVLDRARIRLIGQKAGNTI